MNIFNYIDNYGIYSFEEMEFNDVDAAIFSFLSYINYNDLLDNKRLSISTLGRLCGSSYLEVDKSIIAERDALKILHYLMDSKRYKNCLLFNNVYESDDESQFSVVSIMYMKNKIYVSYEGTDELLSGWYENFLLSYLYPTKSHLKAIKYLNRYMLSNYQLIVGGHSKGGNLALVASMNCNFLVKSKISKIYNMDGPGLLPHIYNSSKYSSIEDRYYHFMPNNSIVGILLENSNDIIIKANIDNILSHDILYWDISGRRFTSSKLTTLSLYLRKNLNNYIYSLSRNELKLVIDNFDLICRKVGVKSVLDLKKDNKKIVMLFREISQINGQTRIIILGLFEVFFKAIGGATKENFYNLMGKFKKNI